MAGDFGVVVRGELIGGEGDDVAGLLVMELAADVVGEAGAFLDGLFV